MKSTAINELISYMKNEGDIDNDPYQYRLYQVLKMCKDDAMAIKILGEAVIMLSKQYKELYDEIEKYITGNQK